MKNPFNSHKNKEFFDLELGLGKKTTKNQKRLIEKNGNFNVKRTGLSPFKVNNVYHFLTTIHWFKFIALIFLVYFILNIFFATLYVLTGIHELVGENTLSPKEQFLEAFFFSSQTLTTVGYGRISPLGFTSNFIAMIESMTGLLIFAICTGILYGRFSKPNIKIQYSPNVLISPYKEGKALMFRIANIRKNQLIEAEIQVMFSWIDPEVNLRKYHRLPIETSKINFFPLSWTIVHPITEESPMYNWTEADTLQADVEIMTLFKAHDDIYNQSIHSRYSYKAEEMKWNYKFLPMFYVEENGTTILELDKINSHQKV